MASHRGILVGVDGSPESESAVEWAAREAVLHGVPLTLAHVLPSAQALTWYEVSVSSELDEIAQRRAREILRQATLVAEQAVANEGPITISEHVEEGNATKTMVDLSKDAQLLVVGNRGLGRVGRALLGSVSSGLIHHAHCSGALFPGPGPQPHTVMPRPSTRPGGNTCRPMAKAGSPFAPTWNTRWISWAGTTS